MSQRQAIKAISVVYCFIMLLVCMRSYGGIDKEARTDTDEFGNVFCTDCQKRVEICGCKCPKCDAPYRYLDKPSGKGTGGVNPARRCGNKVVVTKGACKCHQEPGQDTYCPGCVRRKESCICNGDKVQRKRKDDGATGHGQKKRKPCTNKHKTPFQPGGGASVIALGEQLVHKYVWLPPTLDGTFEGATTSNQHCPKEEEDSKTEEGEGSGDILDKIVRLVNAASVPVSNIPVVNQLGELLAQFHPEEPFQQAAINTHAVSLFSGFGAQQVAISQDVEVEIDPNTFMHLMIINDNGTLRLVLVFWNGVEWMLVFRNRLGDTVAYVMDFTMYSDLKLALDIGSSDSYPPETVLPVMIAAPVPGMEQLWQAAGSAYQANLASCCAIRQPVIVEGPGYCSTRRSGAGAKMGAHMRQSESQRIHAAFLAGFNEEEQLEVVPHFISAAIIPDMALHVSYLLATEASHSVSVMGYNYELLAEITPDKCLEHLGNLELILVINPPNPSEAPFIMFVTFINTTATVNLVAINTEHQLADPESDEISITVMQEQFWSILASVMEGLPEGHQIRIYAKPYPEDDADGTGNDD